MDRFTVCDTYYWWLAEHHEGQWSTAYRRLCRLMGYYNPSPLARGPQDPDAYRELCARKGCTHGDRED